MFYTTDENNHGLRYNPFKAIIAPRPIAWVSTRGDQGDNLAPYSFFNAMSDSPPMIGFSAGPQKIKRDEPKDSFENIKNSGVFCVSIVPYALRDAMNLTAGHYAHGDDEFVRAGLSKGQARTIDAPFVAQAPVALECKLWQIIDLPAPGHAHWVIGQVSAVHIKDDLIVDGLLDVTRYEPLARLGYKDYAKVDEVFMLERST